MFIRDKKYKTKFAFTLIELLIVIAIFIVVVSFSFPLYGNLQTKTSLDAIEAELIQSLRFAKIKSKACVDNFAYGVYFATSSNKIVIYQGNSYLTRNNENDIEKNYSSVLNFSTDFGNDINFSKTFALPNHYGIFTINDNNENQIQIKINSLGIIE